MQPARLANHLKQIGRLQSRRRLGEIGTNSAAVISNPMAAEAREFFIQEDRRFLGSERAQRVCVRGGRGFLFSKQCRRDLANFRFGKMEVRHAASFTRMKTEWTNGSR